MPVLAANRSAAIARVQRLIERAHSPRLHMMLIIALTAAVGFLASFTLLHAGIDSLWLRYFIAIEIAYLGFLTLLWCWLRLRSDTLVDALDIPTSGPSSDHSWRTEKPFDPGGGQFGGGGASASFDNGAQLSASPSEITSGTTEISSGVSESAGAFDLEELGFVLIAICALVGAAWASIWIIWAAPALLAELMLDAALAAGLYRRVRGIQSGHWLRTAVRRTVWPFLGVALLFSLAGFSMQTYAPDAKSIGQVFQR